MIEIVVLLIALLMYIEGTILAAALAMALKPSKIIFICLIVLWPVAIPLIAYKTYCKFKPLILQYQQLQALQNNPFLQAFAQQDINQNIEGDITKESDPHSL